MTKRHFKFFAVILLLASSGGLLSSCSILSGSASAPVYTYRVVKKYPHDPSAFTEGLAYRDGYLYEGTGIPGSSTLRRVQPETGKVLLFHQVPKQYFAEGIAIFGDRVVQITEYAQVGFIYNIENFKVERNFNYPTKGWGITYDGKNLIMSDGSAKLYFLDPVSFQEIRCLEVTDKSKPVPRLNELEYIRGEIYANVWPTDRIARINPDSGRVTAWLDLVGLLSPADREQIDWSVLKGRSLSLPLKEEACLNGIAFDPEHNRIFVTGKLWPRLFVIEVVPRRR